MGREEHRLSRGSGTCTHYAQYIGEEPLPCRGRSEKCVRVPIKEGYCGLSALIPTLPGSRPLCTRALSSDTVRSHSVRVFYNTLIERQGRPNSIGNAITEAGFNNADYEEAYQRLMLEKAVFGWNEE